MVKELKEENLSIYPKYLVRGYLTAKNFAQKRNKDRGILLLFGNTEDIKKITSAMDGNIAKKYLSKYGNPLLYSDAVLELYEEMSRHERRGKTIWDENDGAVAFDREGNLIDTGLYVEEVRIKDNGRLLIPLLSIEKIEKYKRGTRHRAAAYASTKGIDSIVVSEGIGTVMTFLNGYIINDLSYIPKDVENEFGKHENNNSVDDMLTRTIATCEKIIGKIRGHNGHTF